MKTAANIDVAVENAYQTTLAGPAACSEIIWTVRKFWLECAKLNANHPTEMRVIPEVFLLQWLADDNQDEWVKVLSGMPYWPIGIDESGNWV